MDSIKHWIATIIYGCIILGYTIFAYIKPYNDWDFLAYVGCALSYEESDEIKIHSQTYELARQSVSETEYEILVGKTSFDSAYRSDAARDPHHFSQQLHFYKSRFLYTFMIYMAMKLGLPVVRTIAVISVISALLTMVLMYVWVSIYIRGVTGSIMTLLLINQAGIISLARFSTPDALSTLLIVLAFYLWTERENLLGGVLTLIASITIRPDNIIIYVIAVTSLLWLKESAVGLRIKKCMVLLAIGVGTYFSLSAIGGSYSWRIFFSHAFMGRSLTPLDNPVSISIGDYSRIIAAKALNIYEISISAFLFISLVAITIIPAMRSPRPILLRLISGLLLTVCCRFLLFPQLEYRHYAAISLVLGVLSVAVIRIVLSEHGRAKGALST